MASHRSLQAHPNTQLNKINMDFLTLGFCSVAWLSVRNSEKKEVEKVNAADVLSGMNIEFSNLLKSM